MPDYNNNCIYKICCKDENIKELYIGHTTNFNIRKGGHKTNCNNEKGEHYSLLLYQFIRMNGGWENFDMIKLYDHPCSSLKEACIEERKCMEGLNCKLNTINSYTSEQERLENNKLNCKEYRINNAEKIKEYNHNNREKIRLQKNEYYQNNKENNKEKKKEYYEQYYQINKEPILLQKKGYAKAKVNCKNCNKLLSRSSLYNHKKKCKSD